MTKTATPGKSSCEDVAEYLNVPLQNTVKSLVLASNERTGAGKEKTTITLLLLRGDHSLNEVKLSKISGFGGYRFPSEGETANDGSALNRGEALEFVDFRFATLGEIEDHFGCKPGYLGPLGLLKPLNLVVDRDVAVMSDWICGANEEDFHTTGVNWGRDLPEPTLIADLRNVVAGDASPDGQGVLAIERGIEVGHIFYLGTKYSQAMNATFLDMNGKPSFMEMGCYGIGVTRLPAAAIEQNHDERGIIWPDALAPFTVVLCPISPDRFPDVKLAADTLYAELLAAGVDVILDDRNERPGAMFADWELIGVPHRVTLGDRGLKDGQVEYQHRRDAASVNVPVADIAQLIKSRLTV
jgi:prolyl-tRNA synthetase